MQAPEKIAGPPPERHLGMDRPNAQRSFLGFASPGFPFAGKSPDVFSCRFRSCRHWAVLLVAPVPLPAQRQIFSIWSYLHASGTMLGFYPRCAQMQSAKKLQIRRRCRFGQSHRSRRVTMQGRALLMRAGEGVAAARVARPAIAQTRDPVRRRLATSWPKSLDTLYGSVEAMCQRVGQLTDRKFQIQSFAGGEIVPPLQVWDATQNGTVECGHTLTSFNIGKNPAVAFDSGLAFGLNTRQQQAWMNYGGGLELIRALFKKDGILPIPCGNVGVQMGGFYRKEINSVDDLKGLKFRIGGLGGMILAKFGVVPLQIPTADIYP